MKSKPGFNRLVVGEPTPRALRDMLRNSFSDRALREICRPMKVSIGKYKTRTALNLAAFMLDAGVEIVIRKTKRKVP